MFKLRWPFATRVVRIMSRNHTATITVNGKTRNMTPDEIAKLDAGFVEMDRGFREMDKAFDAMDAAFDKIDTSDV